MRILNKCFSSRCGEKAKYNIFYGFILSLTFLLSFSANALHEVLEYEFWPKTIEPGEISSSGYEFPGVIITLTDKYHYPVFVEESLYNALSKRLNVEEYPFIKQSYTQGYWDIAIPTDPNEKNLEFAEFFVSRLSECLSSIDSEDDARLIAEFVIDPDDGYSSTSKLNQRIALVKPIINEMYQNYSDSGNRCQVVDNSFKPSSFVIQRMNTMFRSILTDSPKTNFSRNDLYVSVRALEDLLFSENGFWVRNSLKVVQPMLGDLVDGLLDSGSVDLLYEEKSSFYEFVRLNISGDKGLDEFSLNNIATRCLSLYTLGDEFDLGQCMPKSGLEVDRIIFNSNVGWVIR